MTKSSLSGSICVITILIMGLPLSARAQEKPTEFALHQNYPNPFNPVSTIEYSLPRASEVSLFVYDITGREVAKLVEDNMVAGNHQAQWNGQGFASGIYIARLVTPEYTKSIKMVLLK